MARIYSVGYYTGTGVWQSGSILRPRKTKSREHTDEALSGSTGARVIVEVQPENQKMTCARNEIWASAPVLENDRA